MVRWLPWGADAFARASRERKPVLLSITAAWCGACHEMDRTTYADPAVAALIHERFVPVRVDTDRRPDINERYNLGGWPTTAFLTSSGALITGGTFVTAERMPGVLAQVAAAMAQAPDPEVHHDAESMAGAASPPSDADVIEAIFATFDETFGGFGVEPKFPHTAPLHLAMGLFHETGAERWRVIVRRTLDALTDGGLWDRQAGGFYRYATTRDWRLPHQEKLLETNAALLRIYAEAGGEWGDAADVERCRATAAFITTVLRSDTGGYYGSDADAVLFMDSNAAAAGALLKAASMLDDRDLAREALTSFERVLLLCYKPGRGLAHYFDGSACVRGLLADHLAAIGALLDAHDVSGLEPYRMMAEELGHIVVRDLRDSADGAFFDRAETAEDVGLLRARRKPFVGNAEAAIAFGRLSRLEPRAGFPDPAAFRTHADTALAAATRQLDGQGPLAAHYALARRLLID